MKSIVSNESGSRLRDWRIWVGITFVVYTLFGFFAVPSIVRWQLVKQSREMLGREASAVEVRFNPYTLALTVRGFQLRDLDGEAFVSFDELLLNASVASPFRWAGVVDELRISGPRVRARLLEDGRLSFMDLFERSRDEAIDEEGPPRIDIELLDISGGVFEFVDMARSPVQELRFDDLNLSLRHLSTIDDDEGAHEVAFRFDEGTVLRWSGALQAKPLLLDGRFDLEGLNVASAWEYFGVDRPFALTEGRVDAALSYRIERTGQDEIHLAISNGSAEVTGLTLVDRSTSEEWLDVDSVAIGSVSAAWPEKTVEVGSVVVNGPSAEAFLDESGRINWNRYVSQRDDSGGQDAGMTFPVDLTIEGVEIADGKARVSDKRKEPPATAVVSGLAVKLTGFAWPEREPARVEVEATVGNEGSVRVKGNVSLAAKSADLDVDVSRLSVPEHLAWLPEIPFGRLVSGTAGMQGSVKIRGNELPRASFAGAATLADAEIVNPKGERLLAIGELLAAGVSAQVDPARVTVERVRVSDPFAKIRIDSEGALNLERAAFSAVEKEVEFISSAAPIQFDVKVIEVERGEVDYADLSLVLPFAANVTGARGEIRDLSSSAMAGSRVEIEGNVEESGYAKVEGTLRPFDPFAATELRVIFRNVDMSTLTPYAAEFAGYAIEEGRLDLDVRYVIRERLLRGHHNVLAHDLVLGDRIEGASDVSLPLKLAVALLKDKDGKIDLDVPMEGSVDDPEFNYRKVAWAALKQILVNVATKPFTFIGDLLGISGDELERVAFEAGDARLLPPEVEQLRKIVAELAGRTEIRIEIEPVFDPSSDADAIRERKLEAELSGKREELGADSSVDQALESLYVLREGNEPLELIRQRHTTTDAEGKVVFDGAAFYSELRAALLAAEPVEPHQLTALASERGAAILAALTGEGGVEASRVSIVGPKELSKKEAGGELVASRLTLVAD